jgi:hypothetical protein
MVSNVKKMVIHLYSLARLVQAYPDMVCTGLRRLSLSTVIMKEKSHSVQHSSNRYAFNIATYLPTARQNPQNTRAANSTGAVPLCLRTDRCYPVTSHNSE